MAQQAQNYQQPPQYQYQHYQQYQQYQQPQQAQHYQQNQVYNYNTHQQQPQSYAQNYPQQYLRQQSQQYQPQYPQQHPIAQQHGPPHSVNYPQQQTLASDAPPEPETCYNCGVADHFAQNCPEPRREVPAGSLKRQKRHYSRRPQYNNNGQINTNMPSPQAYQQATYPQQGFSQYQQPYSPATPYSAQSPTSQQWRRPSQQQQHQYQPNQQIHQQNQHPPSPASYQAQSTYYQSQAYSTPATPVPGSQSTPVQASPPVSHQGSVNQTPQSAPASSVYWPAKGSEAAPESQQSDAQATRDAVHPNDELEEDDLHALDIPDLPASTNSYGECVLNRVSRPLPANFIVADAIFPIPPPAPEAGGKCLSKYLDNLSEDEVVQHIEFSHYWNDHKDDTMFQHIVDDGNSIPIEVCLANVKERQKPQIGEETRRNSRSESRSVAPRSAEAAEMAESLETLERALAEAKAKQAEMIRNRRKAKPRQSSASLEHQRANVDEDANVKVEQQSPPQSVASNIISQRTGYTEDILASLGVTGSPKPVPIATRTISQASPPVSAIDDPGRHSSKDFSNSHTPSLYLENQRGSFQGNSAVRYSQKQGHSAHPPPPPPPIQTSPHENGTEQSPDSGVIDPYFCSTKGNGYHPNGADRRTISPTQHRTERSLSRKRSYDQCEESSSEEDDSPRRQEDDITPKHKKRQPKVAAAYSRRW